MLFEKYYLQSLEEQTWNSGYNNLFGNFKQSARHRKIIKDPKFRKNPQTVPDMHKKDMTDIPKVERMKNSAPGIQQVISQGEFQQIARKYNLNGLSYDGQKNLGNTGISVKFDPNFNSYVLVK
jgi:hypothetical protein